MDKLRTPFFVVAMVAAALVVLVELGMSLLLGGHNVGADFYQQAGALGVDVPAGGQVSQPSGRGIPYLALVDVIPLFVVGLMGAGLILPHKLHGRLQGVVTLIGAIVLILTALVLLIVAIVEVILMVTLLFAFPFGTIAYLIIWGSFPRGDAVVILSLLMFLKLVFAAALVAAQQRFIQNKGLVLLVLTSLVANLIVAFLHGLVPGFLVSITDGIAAIVLAIIAIIWAIVLLIGAIPAIVKAVRSTASTVESTAANTAKAVGSTAARRLPA